MSSGSALLQHGQHAGCSFAQVLAQHRTYAAFLFEEHGNNWKYRDMVNFIQTSVGGVMRYGQHAGHTFHEMVGQYLDYARWLCDEHHDNPKYSNFARWFRSLSSAELRTLSGAQATRTAPLVAPTVMAPLATTPVAPTSAPLMVATAAISAAPAVDEGGSETSSEESGEEVSEKLLFRHISKRVLKQAGASLNHSILVRRVAQKLVDQHSCSADERLKWRILASLPQAWLSPSSAQVRLPKRARRTCSLCMERTINTAFVPCGHRAACSSCAQRCRQGGCPICRQPVASVLDTFDA